MDSGRPTFQLENIIAAILLAVLLVSMTIQIVLRFGFGSTISWLEEVIRIFFVWSVYACVLVAAVDDMHIRVALHISLLPKRLQALILALADVGWIAFNALIIYGGVVYSLDLLQFPYRMPTTGINLVWVFSIIPIAFTLLSLRIFVNIVRRWRGNLDMTDIQKEM